MSQNRFPEGWSEEKVRRVLTHYEEQTEDEAVAEDEAGIESSETVSGKPPVDFKVQSITQSSSQTLNRCSQFSQSNGALTCLVLYIFRRASMKTGRWPFLCMRLENAAGK
jgi:hypothetical protein